MLFQKTQTCFNEPHYVTVHSAINMMTTNGVKVAHKMPQQRFYAFIMYHLLEKGFCNHTMTNVGVWLSCYV